MPCARDPLEAGFPDVGARVEGVGPGRGAGVEASFADLHGHGRTAGEIEPARFSLSATLAGLCGYLLAAGRLQRDDEDWKLGAELRPLLSVECVS